MPLRLVGGGARLVVSPRFRCSCRARLQTSHAVLLKHRSLCFLYRRWPLAMCGVCSGVPPPSERVRDPTDHAVWNWASIIPLWFYTLCPSPSISFLWSIISFLRSICCLWFSVFYLFCATAALPSAPIGDIPVFGCSCSIWSASVVASFRLLWEIRICLLKKPISARKRKTWMNSPKSNSRKYVWTCFINRVCACEILLLF